MAPSQQDLHCITQYYAYQGIFWKPEKTSKFQPIHSTDFHENEEKKKKKIEKKSKMAVFQKWPFFKIANSQKIFVKISQVRPWVSRIA
jgi:hypothetical protein